MLRAYVVSDIPGNAATATILETARTINGVSFNGSANITVTAAAGTLTGTTLKSTVLSSSLTSLGTIASLAATEIASPSIAVDNATEGGTAQMTVQSVQEVVTLSGASTKDTTIAIPNGSLLLGASFCVNTEVADASGDDTWSAAYVTGASTSLASGAAKTVNTKIDKLVVPELAGAATEIRFTSNSGNFTGGVIEVVAYYIDLTSLANV